jgi:O-antigen/teichoic acid export membrane protein
MSAPMRSVQHSIFFSAIERYGNFLLFLLSTAVLSRLLTPAEFGVYAVVNAIFLILTASFQELGGANYLIQKQDLTKENIRTAFTVVFATSALIGIFLYFTADIFAWLFREQGLKRGIEVAALSLVVTPFSVVMTALLRRNMALNTLAICSLIGNCIGVAASILLAVWHFSFMAPIWGALVGSCALAILLAVFSKDILVVFRPLLSDCSEIFSFGLYSAGISLINVLYNLIPQLFLARVLDFNAVGLFTRAGGITQVFDKLVGQVLGPVVMPAIFAQIKAGRDLKNIYLEAAGYLAVVQWPFLTFIAILAYPIILVWLGPTWLEITPLVRMMCVANLALFAACLTYPVLVAVGRVRDSLVSSLISLPPSLALIFIASFFGVEAVAASMLVTLPFQAAVAIHFIRRNLKFQLSELTSRVSKAAIVTLMTSGTTAVCAVLIEQNWIPVLTGLVVASCLGLGCWILGLALTAHPLLAKLQLAAREVVRLFLRHDLIG